MDSINIADLRDELNTLIDRLEAGEVVEITRDGQPFARVTPEALPLPSYTPIDLDMLAQVRVGAKGGMTVEDMRRLDLL